MDRITIIVEKNQSTGAVGNISAVLLGQASLVIPELYLPKPVFDKSGIRHSGIQISAVILKAGQGQLLNFVKNVKEIYPGVLCIAFSQIGQTLNNKVQEYSELIENSTTEDSKIVGAIVVAEEELVKTLTKKFSLF